MLVDESRGRGIWSRSGSGGTTPESGENCPIRSGAPDALLLPASADVNVTMLSKSELKSVECRLWQGHASSEKNSCHLVLNLEQASPLTVI
jgi:hypothetical protein